MHSYGGSAGAPPPPVMQTYAFQKNATRIEKSKHCNQQLTQKQPPTFNPIKWQGSNPKATRQLTQKQPKNKASEPPKSNSTNDPTCEQENAAYAEYRAANFRRSN
jgi:hypothetical protein